MDKDKLWALMKKVDPSVVRMPKSMLEIANAIESEEREACARECDYLHHTWRWDDTPDSDSGPRSCAAAIRARSNH